MGLLVTFILGIFLLVGMFVIRLAKNSKKVEQLSISIALGTMSSLVFLELFPEVFKTFKNDNIFITCFTILLFSFAGILILKLLDKFIPEHDNNHSLDHHCSNENVVHIGIVSSVAIMLHNIIEGMAIYSMMIDSPKLGMLVAFGVGLHNIPMGMVIYSTLEKEDKSKKIVLISLTVLSTFIGGILMLLINNLLSETIIGVLVCITLGMLIYIILFELIPHIMHSKNKKLSLVGVIIGIVIMLITLILE